jgi:broad specificity phosphatase PhoE
MEPPGITRHRRPFLAPLWVGLLGALAIAVAAWSFRHAATTTVVILVRPAEKDSGTIEDPPLSPEGEARAQRLARMFGEVSGAGRVEAVYESEERRAQQTGAPLVQRLRLAPGIFSAADAGAAAARALREHPGATVLIIASGAAQAQIIRELTGAQAFAAAPDDPDLIGIVSVPSFGSAHLARFKF